MTCQTPCTVKHVLILYRAFALTRKRFFNVNSLSNLFENINLEDVLYFLREIRLHQKIWYIPTEHNANLLLGSLPKLFTVIKPLSHVFCPQKVRGWLYEVTEVINRSTVSGYIKIILQNTHTDRGKITRVYTSLKCYNFLFISFVVLLRLSRHHHHHHVTLSAWISLILSRHLSLSSIASGSSSGLHPVSAQSYCM